MEKRISIINLVELYKFCAFSNMLYFLSKVNDTIPEEDIHPCDWEINYFSVVNVEWSWAVFENFSLLVNKACWTSIHL